jgi:hypothetical protein
MKKFLLFLFVFSSTAFLMAQENAITINGGYSFANIEDADLNSTGWRINGTYEFNAMMGKVSHGIALGYISMTATAEGAVPRDYTLSSLPVYYMPKYLFGNDKLKGFVKGALGMHFSNYQVSGVAGLDTEDLGFYGGLGLGGNINLSEKLFINLEYEWAYLSNSYYRDGFVNSAMGGIGFRF